MDEPIVEHALETARNAAVEMGINGAVEVIGELDGLPPDAIFDLLEKKLAPEMLIVGDWRKSNLMGIDVYDFALKFIEDNFSKARRKKSDEGWYILIAGDKL